MPESTYAIVQLNGYINLDGSTVNATLFPKVPIEAVVKSVNEMDTPVGDPATVIQLTAMTATAPTPTAVGQKYYNTGDKLVYTAVQSGSSVVWDSGAEPLAGKLYSVNEPVVGDTLYIKSVVGSSWTLTSLVFEASAPVSTYAGPFSIEYTTAANQTCTCSVTDSTGVSDGGAGYIYAATTAVRVQTYDNISVPTGSSIWLHVVVLLGVTTYTVNTTASYTPPAGTLKTSIRLATNKNGVMIQCHYGDVVLGSLA